jgi:urease accessory protein
VKHAPRPLYRTVAVVALLTLCAPAHAHLVTTGLGPLYDGIVHFFVSIEDVLPALALALLAGLQGARAGRRALFLTPVAWLAGGALAIAVPLHTSNPLLGVIALLGIGILAATDRRVAEPAVSLLSIGLGFGLGYLSASSVSRESGVSALGLLGACVSAFVIIALAAAIAVAARRPTARIVVRVAASWLAAIGLLRLGWWLSGAG